jgi:hypothetical protein
MTRTASWLALATVLTVALPASAGQAARASASAAARPTRRDGNLVVVNSRPALLLWAAGLDDPAQVEQYRAAGFNTAYLAVATTKESDLAAAGTLADAAEQAGLMLVVCLAPEALEDSQGNHLAIDATSDDYKAAVTSFVRAAVDRLGKHDRLIAWSVAAVPPGQVVVSDEGFRAQLQEWYSSLDALNASWGSQLADWDRVSTTVAREIDSTFPGGLGRASVDYAYYREEAYADALSLWAAALHAADAGRLVFASALPDYRSIISVRSDFDGMVLNTYPSLAEPDDETHNVHAVDIARRANQFAAIPMLEVRFGADAGTVAHWANLALMHGAAGIAFSSWPNIRDSGELTEAVRQLSSPGGGGPAFPQRPLARTAILYEPIAGGRVRNGQGLYGYLDGVTPDEPTGLFLALRDGTRYGQFDVLASDSLGGADLGQYGAIIAPMALYLKEDTQLVLQSYVLQGGALLADAGVGMYQATGEIASVPAILQEVFGVRYANLAQPEVAPGTITAGSPGEAGSAGQLGQSGLKPPARPSEFEAVRNPEVRRFMDLMQAWLGQTDVATHLGSEFTAGTGPQFRVREYGRGFGVYVPIFLYEEWSSSDPRFSDLHAALLSRKADIEVLAPGEDGIYSRPSWSQAAEEAAAPEEEADSAYNIPVFTPESAESVPGQGPGGTLAAPYAGESGLGPGQPVGPPQVMPLPPGSTPETADGLPVPPEWAGQPPEPGAVTALPVAPGLLPSQAAAQPQAPAVQLWPPGSVAVYQGWTLGISSPNGQSVVVDAFAEGNQMYLIPGGAMRLPNPDEDGRAELVFPGAPLALVAPVSIYLRPRGEGTIITASVARYDSGGIELLVHGDDARLQAGAAGLEITGGAATPVEIEIRDGAYRVTAGSLHRLVIREGARETVELDQVVMPNPDTGSLLIQGSPRWARITIEPAQ